MDWLAQDEDELNATVTPWLLWAEDWAICTLAVWHHIILGERMCQEGEPERKSTVAQEMSKGQDKDTSVITPTPLFHT
jgi:hypothetical protein